jgi:hypothetical protein
MRAVALHATALPMESRMASSSSISVTRMSLYLIHLFELGLRMCAQ